MEGVDALTDLSTKEQQAAMAKSDKENGVASVSTSGMDGTPLNDENLKDAHTVDDNGKIVPVRCNDKRFNFFRI